MSKIADILVKALSNQISTFEQRTLMTEFSRLETTTHDVGSVIGRGGYGSTVFSGQIGGWFIGPEGLYSDDQQVRLVPGAFPRFSLGFLSGGYDDGTGIWMGLDSDNIYKFRVGDPDAEVMTWDGSALSVTGTIIADAGDIGGWNITATTIEDDTGGIVLDSSVPKIDVGNIEIGDGYIQTSNFVSGSVGWQIQEDGTAEFNNVYVRGEIHAPVFVKDLIEAHAGTLMVAKSAGMLDANMVVPASSTWTMTIKDPPGGGWLFTGDGVNDDVCRVLWEDGSTYSTWFTVVQGAQSGGQQTYTCTYQSGTRPHTYEAGIVVVDYGQSGQGYLVMTADLNNAPYYDVRTHAGAPWSAETTKTRLGNLAGITDADLSPSGYGIYSNNAYFRGAIKVPSNSVLEQYDPGYYVGFGDVGFIASHEGVSGYDYMSISLDSSTSGHLALVSTGPSHSSRIYLYNTESKIQLTATTFQFDGDIDLPLHGITAAAYIYSDVSGTSGGFKAGGVGDEVHWYSNGSDTWRTPDSVIIDSNLTVSGGTVTIGADTNIYRDSANVLKTDDQLNVVGDIRTNAGLSVGNLGTNPATGDIETSGEVLATGDIKTGQGLSVGSLVTNPGTGEVIATGKVVGYFLTVTDGVTAPSADSGYAHIFVDTADGDLKVTFGDGTTKTIATDT